MTDDFYFISSSFSFLLPYIIILCSYLNNFYVSDVLMNINNVLLGAFVGVLAVAMFTPLITFYGFNSMTSMILLYTLPLVGAASVFITEELSPEKRGKEKGMLSVKRLTGADGLSVKTAVIHTNMGGVYKGIVSGEEGGMIVLEKASRLDIPESSMLDRLFIDRNDVKRMEMSSEKNDELPV